MAELQSKGMTETRSAPGWSGLAISTLCYWLNVTVKQVWVLWHRRIEGTETGSELTVTGYGAPLTGPELANGSSDRPPHSPQGHGDLEESTGPHLYRTMHRVSVENSLMKTRMLLNRNQVRHETPYLTGQLCKVGYHPKKAVVTISIKLFSLILGTEHEGYIYSTQVCITLYHDSTVRIAATLRAGQSRNYGSITRNDKGFSLLQSIQAGTRAYPPSYSMNMGGLSHRGYRSHSVQLITHLHLVQGLGMSITTAHLSHMSLWNAEGQLYH
jgi:hypothetical protein